MKEYAVTCPICSRQRIISYKHYWAIQKGITTLRCFKCTRLKSGETNTGSFKDGNISIVPFKVGHTPWNKGRLGYKNKPYTLAQRIAASERQRGENAPNWQGGRTTINKVLRQSLEFKLWREAIFERDDYACVLCGKRGTELHPDHYPIQMALLIDQLILEQGSDDIIEKALKYAPLWDINGGRTLCAECHRATPSYGKNIPGKRANKSNLALSV